MNRIYICLVQEKGIINKQIDNKANFCGTKMLLVIHSSDDRNVKQTPPVM
jgi:hypothetical protein